MAEPRESVAKPPSLAPRGNRSVGIDLVRFLGICAIVIGHVSVNPWVVRATYTWHVPVFFFLAGVLWPSGRTPRQEVLSRFASLGRPYLSWLLAISLLAVPRAAVQGDPHLLLRRVVTIVLGGSYLGTPFTAFWFFSCLLVACIIWRLGERSRVPWWGMALVALPLTLLGPSLAMVPLSAGTALPATVFIAAGRAYQRAPDRLKAWPVGLVALAVAAAAVISGVDPPLDLKNGYFGTPVLGIVFACLICAGLLSCANAIAAHLGRLGRRLSAEVMTYGAAVVLAHGLPIAFLYGRAATGLVLAGVVVGTAFLVGAAGLSPWRSALLGLRQERRPEAESPA